MKLAIFFAIIGLAFTGMSCADYIQKELPKVKALPVPTSIDEIRATYKRFQAVVNPKVNPCWTLSKDQILAAAKEAAATKGNELCAIAVSDIISAGQDYEKANASQGPNAGDAAETMISYLEALQDEC